MKRYSTTGKMSDLLAWVDLPSGSYYYKPNGGKRGLKPSTYPFRQDSVPVSNETVVEKTKQALNREFCYYGYHNITSYLKDLNYIINHKKVYRLMDENLMRWNTFA